MSKKEKSTRASFMCAEHPKKMKGFPRTHINCKAQTGVMLPGKTAKVKSL